MKFNRIILFISIVMMKFTLVVALTHDFGSLINGGVAPLNSIMLRLGLNTKGVLPILNLDVAPGLDFKSIMLCTNITSDQFQQNCQQNIDYIANNKLFGLNSVDNVVNYIKNTVATTGITNVKFDYVKYVSPKFIDSRGMNESNVTLSGLVVLPVDSNGNVIDAHKIKGVYLYYHPTSGSIGGTPSGFNSNDLITNFSTFIYQYQFASLMASHGYIVIAPDYQGQGSDDTSVHPYVFGGKWNALSGIYMLKAVNTYLTKQYNVPLDKLANNKLFIDSYSEGATYALYATNLLNYDYSHILTQLNLKLIKTFGISGAYDASGTTLDFMLDNVYNGNTAQTNKWNVNPGCMQSGDALCAGESNGLDTLATQYLLSYSKTVLSTYLLGSLKYYYSSLIPNNIISNNFSNIGSCIDTSYDYSAGANWKNGLCSNIFYVPRSNNFESLFLDVNANTLNNFNLIFSLALQDKYFIGNTNNFAGLLNNSNSGVAINSITNFVNPDIVNDKSLNQLLRYLLSYADVYNLSYSTPIDIMYLKYDSVVPNKNSSLACQNPNATQVTCIMIDNTQMWDSMTFFGSSDAKATYLTHPDAATIMPIIVLNSMEQY